MLDQCAYICTLPVYYPIFLNLSIAFYFLSFGIFIVSLYIAFYPPAVQFDQCLIHFGRKKVWGESEVGASACQNTRKLSSRKRNHSKMGGCWPMMSDACYQRTSRGPILTLSMPTGSVSILKIKLIVKLSSLDLLETVNCWQFFPKSRY